MNRTVTICIVIVIYILAQLPADVNAQHKISLQLALPASIHPDTSKYFMASDLNKWNPRDTSYQFTYKNNNLQLDIPFGDSIIFQYKITRGEWSKGECDEDGYGAANRMILAHHDTLVMVKVLGWTDQVNRKHTASPHVQLLSDSFPMHTLHSSRRIWIYLPPSYHHSRKHYPVIYMNDGQNLFDRATTAFGTEWKADETMDSVISTGKREFIIVAIEAGEERLQEYLPYKSRHIKQPGGKEYAGFLANELVPYIDKHFRTLKGASNRSIAGSSMGGLISLFTLMEFPAVFGSAGVLSCSYWVIDDFEKVLYKDPGKKSLKVFLYAGDAEMKSLIPDTERMKRTLEKNPFIQVKTMYTEGGQHSEYYWQKPFLEFILWIQQ